MALYVKLADVVPLHTEGLLPNVMVGLAFTVTVMAELLLTQPVVLLRTVKVALYVPAAAPPGTVIVMGLAGSATLVTSAKPCPSAVPSKLILY